MKKKLVTYLLTIVLILSCVWVDPIRSYGQTEDEISSAEDVSNTEADQESFEKSETDSVDDEELNNDVEKNAGVPLENASSGSEEVLAEGNSLESEASLDSEKALEQNTDSDVSTQGETAYSYNSTSTSGAVTLKVEWTGLRTGYYISCFCNGWQWCLQV